MAFGDILRELIELNNITQKQLGQALNIAASTIGNYVRNIREPDHKTLIEIAKYFHVSTDFLLEFSGETKISHEEESMVMLFRKLNNDYKQIFYKQGLAILEVQEKLRKQ